jgi:hypothetical protein
VAVEARRPVTRDLLAIPRVLPAADGRWAEFARSKRS